ncbi:MAG TPA: hypothetical protein VFB13_18485 [Reyranella sp.]|nr:hypothetical protein [Reyranella sp.]
MRIIVKAALAALAVCASVGDALAQSQGPLTTLPWAARSRSKPAEKATPPTPDDQQLTLPSAGKPVQGASEPAKPATADSKSGDSKG